MTHKLSNQSKTLLAVSATTGQGCDTLLKTIDAKLTAHNKIYQIEADVGNGKLQSWLYTNAEVINKMQTDEKLVFSVKIGATEAAKLYKIFGIKLLA